MKFCEECGKPLIIKENYAECICGFITESEKISSTEKIDKSLKKGKGVLEEDKSEKGFPHTCKKCGNEFAEVIDLGIFYSDEASIYLFKCKKCNYTEREAYGSCNA